MPGSQIIQMGTGDKLTSNLSPYLNYYSVQVAANAHTQFPPVILPRYFQPFWSIERSCSRQAGRAGMPRPNKASTGSDQNRDGRSQARLVRVLFTPAPDQDPALLLCQLVRTGIISACPQPARWLQFMAWGVEQHTGQQTGAVPVVHVWAQAMHQHAPPRLEAWARMFPGGLVQPMNAQGWISTLKYRSKQSPELFCSPEKVRHAGKDKFGAALGTPVCDMEQHLAALSAAAAANLHDSDFAPGPSKAEVSLMSVTVENVASEACEQFSSPQKRQKLQGSSRASGSPVPSRIRKRYEWTPQARFQLLEAVHKISSTKVRLTNYGQGPPKQEEDLATPSTKVRLTNYGQPKQEEDLATPSLNPDNGDARYLDRLVRLIQEGQGAPWPTDAEVCIQLKELMGVYGRDGNSFKRCQQDTQYLMQPLPSPAFEWTPRACALLVEGIREKSYVSVRAGETLSPEVGDGGYIWRLEEFMAERLLSHKLWVPRKGLTPTGVEIRVKLLQLILEYGTDYEGFKKYESACKSSCPREEEEEEEEKEALFKADTVKEEEEEEAKEEEEEA